MGEHKEPFPFMRGSNFGSFNSDPFRIEPEIGKLPENSFESQGKVPSHVLQADESRSHFTNDSGNFRPEVAGVVFASSFAGGAEWLAWVSGRDEIHLSAPRSAIEGFKIVVDRRAIQGRVFHPCHESARGVSVPLNEAHASELSAESSGDSKLEASNPGT